VWLRVEDGKRIHTATVQLASHSTLAVGLSPDADAILVGSSTGLLSLIRITDLSTEQVGKLPG
jgi:hypothetical protein